MGGYPFGVFVLHFVLYTMITMLLLACFRAVIACLQGVYVCFTKVFVRATIPGLRYVARYTYPGVMTRQVGAAEATIGLTNA